MTTIYSARRVITMNSSTLFAEAVAVRDGRVLGVGTVDELRQWGPASVDDRFASHVLVPGFVEAHTHLMAGGMWESTYVGFYERTAPDGTVWSGCVSVDDVIERLIEADHAIEDPDEVLMAWGLDPIYLEGERLAAHDLDRVSTTRPIYVQHASFHVAAVNTKMLEVSGITSETKTPGVSRRADGTPDGELQEPPAMQLAALAFERLKAQFGSPEAAWNYGSEARNSGLTFMTDLATPGLDDLDVVMRFQSLVNDTEFPVRMMLAGSLMFGGSTTTHDELAERVAELVEESTDKLHFGIVKIVLDGSIQGFTARVSWPHYFKAPSNHPGNGLWLIAPDQVADIVAAYHRAGLIVHCHCNGDEASEVFIDAVERALEAHPRWDHRHTVQHCQLTTKSQYRRMAALGMCANIFSNHMYYWGDQHRDVTVGPERAAGMDACATALREGIPISIHCDAPVTPMGPLHVAWCAVNRCTASGAVLGPEECISVEKALHAVTLGAAHQLGVDHLVGSIEAGKFADFAVLEDDPYDVDPIDLKDIGVWGTVLGGVPQPASRPGD